MLGSNNEGMVRRIIEKNATGTGIGCVVAEIRTIYRNRVEHKTSLAIRVPKILLCT